MESQRSTRPFARRYWYLSSPYASHPAGGIMAAAMAIAEAARLHQRGVLVYSAIGHTHAMFEGCRIGVTDRHWEDFARAMMAPSAGVILLMLDGWEDSSFVARDIEIAESLGKPIVRMTVGSFPAEIEKHDGDLRASPARV